MSAVIGNCECCDLTDVVVSKMYGTIMMCQECKDKELALAQANNTQEAQQSRVDSHNLTLQIDKEITAGIRVRTDIFNAATVAISDLKTAIDADDSITNKPYALAEVLKERFNHFKQVVFELSEQLVEAGNQQKAIQIYLNQMANQLRVEEREKLQIADISYQPTKPKEVKPKAIKTTSSKKTNKDELAKYSLILSKELGKPVTVFMLQTIVVAKGVTIEGAADILRRTVLESRSISN